MTPETTRLGEALDPTCVFHGKKWSEHEGGFCLYCCVCFNSKLTPETCATDSEGKKWNVCDTEECRRLAGVT